MRDAAPGLFDHQRGRGHVPRMQPFLPEPVEPSASHVSQIERRRTVAAHGLRVHDEVRKMARKFSPLAYVVGKTGAEQRAGKIPDCGNVNAAPVERRALSALGREEFFAYRVVNRAQLQSSFVLQSNRNAKAGVAMRVVRGAVERVDDPAPLGLRFAGSW